MSLLYATLVTLVLLADLTAIILGVNVLRQRRQNATVTHYLERRRNGASSSSTSP